MKKETAVEWLMDKLFDPTYDKGKQIDWFQQAKEMEKQQIVDAYNEGYGTRDAFGDVTENNTGEQYYNETFKNQLQG